MDEMTSPEEPRRFKRLNPVTGAVASIAHAASMDEALACVDAAAAAFPTWSELRPEARRAALHRAADALLAQSEEFIAAIRDEIGGTRSWAMFNVTLAADMVREAAAMTTQIGGEVIPSDKPGCLAMALRQPAGVVLGNAPVILGVRSIAMPLACGNSVVFNGSEICPRIHGLIVQAFSQAGLPAGTVQFVSNAPEDAADIVGALIDRQAVRRVNFTGSTQVGRMVAERAARTLTPVLLELGGKAPMVILEDADLDEAVKAAAFGAFMNQGQICMSTERIIVGDSIADAFLSAFAIKAASLKSADPNAASAPLGAVVDLKTVRHVTALIDDTVLKGALLLVGGHASGVLMDAAVVAGVTADMRLYREESFGPVVAVIRARDEADAIHIANDSDYGLSASVSSRNIAGALNVAKKIQSGICHINGPNVHDEAQMPFGGVKGSGYGRFGGKAAVDEFADLRWITIETRSGSYPI